MIMTMRRYRECFILPLVILSLGMSVTVTSGCIAGCKTQAKTLTCCRMTSFPTKISTEIEVIQILESNIPVFTRNQVSKLPNLKRISLKNCDIRIIGTCSFSGPSEVEVAISNSQIDTIEPFAFTGLKSLDLNIEKSAISRIRSKAFSNIQNVGSWVLARMNITEVEHAAIFNVSGVNKMLIYESNIHKMRQGAMSAVKVNQFTIYNNKFEYGCHTEDQLKAISEVYVPYNNKVKCKCCLNDTLRTEPPDWLDCDMDVLLTTVGTTQIKTDLSTSSSTESPGTVTDGDITTGKTSTEDKSFFSLSDQWLAGKLTNTVPVSTVSSFVSTPVNTGAATPNQTSAPINTMTTGSQETSTISYVNVTSEVDALAGTSEELLTNRSDSTTGLLNVANLTTLFPESSNSSRLTSYANTVLVTSFSSSTKTSSKMTKTSQEPASPLTETPAWSKENEKGFITSIKPFLPVANKTARVVLKPCHDTLAVYETKSNTGSTFQISFMNPWQLGIFTSIMFKVVFMNGPR